MVKEKKSFKKFAKKHLASTIENRRKSSKAKKEKIERVEKKKVKDAKDAAKEEREHLQQLDRLKDTDPQFYSYLEEEDPTLLQFGAKEMELVDDDEGSDAETEVDEEEERDGSGDEDEDGDDDDDDAESKVVKGRVTKEELQQLIAGLRGEKDAGKEKNSTTSSSSSKTQRSAEACIDIFVSAVRELGYEVKEKAKAKATRKFEDPELVKVAITSVATQVGANLSTLISGKGAFKTHKTRYLVRRLLHALVSVIAGGSVDAVLTSTLLRAVVPFIPVLHFIKGLTKAILKAALNLCAAPEEPTRVAAYVVVRSIATRATGTRSMYQSTAFKGIFLALIRTAHAYNIHNLPIVAFLMNCVVDLYGTDLEAGYQHAFVYLRQLAIYLRSALQQQTQANVRAVVNWQYLNALRTWGLVVSTYNEPAQLGPLIHPVVQLAFGLMDLFSSPRMFPLHLHLIEMLNHITQRAEGGSGVYIPIAPYILRILTSPSMSLGKNGAAQGGDSSSSNKKKKVKRASDSGADRTDIQFTMRAKKGDLRDATYRADVWSQALSLLATHMATHSCTVGFPETFWAVDSTLRKLKEEVKVPRLHAQIATIIKHFQGTAQRIVARRDQANFGPCDIVSVKALEDELRQAGNPLMSYAQSLRQNQVEQFSKKQQGVVRGRETLESITKDKQQKKFAKRPRRE